MRAGPLQELRVVELAGLGPAPLAGRMLAELGADVLCVDRPGARADQQAMHAGKAVLEVDLKSPEGLAQVLDALACADVLIEGFRPGTTERLGLGPQVCAELNPRLVYGRMTGWGQHGPLAERAGHDINYLSVTGALHAIGPAGGKPVVPLNLVADFGGGTMFLLVGVLAALAERERSGLGQVVDAAMVDGVSQLMGLVRDFASQGLWADERGVNLLDGGTAYYDTYACADGKHVAVGPLEPQFYAELMAGLGLNVPQDSPALREALTAAFAARTRDEWTEVFAGTDACVSPVLSITEAPFGAHLAARATLVEHGRAGFRAAPAPRFSRTPGGWGPDADAATMLARWADHRP